MTFQVFLIFSILVSAAVAGEGATAAYVPTDVFLFNCGETSDQMDISGRNWMAEQPNFLPSNAANASFVSHASFQGSGVSKVPYMTARIFRHDFTYRFPVSPGWKFLRLYFYPTRYSSDLDAAVNSYFSVIVNGFTLLKNFSADLTAKASNGAFIFKEFIVPVSSGHTMLNLTFTPSLNMLAFVNGVEIVSMPDRFYSKGGFDDKIAQVGNSIDSEINNSTAFETVHRLNIGGRLIDGISDTGMFRQWLAEKFQLNEKSGIVPIVPGVKINYTENTPAYVAPEDVYTTYRTMGNAEHPRLNQNFNLTWLFPVDAGFNYLVRLHFCETLSDVNGPGQRVFTIFIGNKIAKRDMDVIQLSGGSRIPVFLDFSVFVGFESGPRPDLRLDLHPYTVSEPKYYDAILNGVEILKLSVSDGNLAGPNPNPNPTSGLTPNSVNQDIQKPKAKSHVLVITLGTVGFAIVLAMFIVVVIVMKRRKKKKKVNVDTKSKPTDSWTTLPLVTGSSHTRSTTSLPSDLCRRFSILEIKSATNNFEKKLIVGVGGFGPVYKGRIDGGATLVAVKRLDISSNQGVNEFEAELKMLSMLRHIHLVSLVGYCDDENEMVLVYEYMPHGTLRDHLYKRNKVFDPPLSWKRRLEICIDAARGLQYLHTGAKDMIIHRDIKTTNILLDENYVAKVSDFGLSKVGLTSSSQTHVSTVVKGSFGYLDPEYYRRQVLTEKSDLHEAANNKNGVDSLDLPRRDEVGTTTDGENDLFSRTTGRMSKSVTSNDDSARLAGDERSGSSWGVFSEIKDPRARHALLVICILVSAAVLGLGDATAAYKPTDLFLINCGTSSDTIDSQSQTWTSDQQHLLTSKLKNLSFSSDASYQEEVPQVPYTTARIFLSNVNYSFPVSPGWKYLRLYFYPTRYESGFDTASSFFSVTVNGFTLLKNFSADLTVKASKSKSLVKEFIVPVNQTLNLTFMPSPSSLAFVNGIEIVSMPDGFYSKGGFDNMITNVGSTIDFNIKNTTAFETVHRINVGGQMVDEVGDTGMFRRWLPDDDVMLSENSGIKPVVTGVKINYTEKTPPYVAPEDVYKTYRTMGNVHNAEINLNFNMTWLFPVDAGFLYLVRLHFCETLAEVNGPGQRIFTIFLGNQIAKQEMDVIDMSGGSRIPMYLDFNVLVGFENGPRPDLQLDLHPYADIFPKYCDAILNGVEILKLNGSEGSLAGPNPNPLVSSDQTPNHVKPSARKGNNSHVLVITLAVVGSSVVLATFVSVIALLRKKKKTKDVPLHTTSKPTDSCSPLTTYLCRRFSISEIKYATNDFDEKLIVGTGGFGSVYKGRIDGGTTLVAVKRLGIASKQGAKEFKTELEMLSKLRHVHLVSLIGYCDDENEMVLVYEYMPRGTLKDHLYKRNKAVDPPLSWKRRLEICIGAARGLQYLHTGAKHAIIHRDIKTTNILLDENYVAKVSDFGLSKVGPTSESQSHVSTVVKGTFGYLDPEYYRRQVLTVKSDVYSFGVVMFEVLCCRLINIEIVPQEQSDLIRWVKSNYIGGTLDQIIDPDLAVDITMISLEKFCEIAVRCVQDRGTERPPMNDVVWGLEFTLQLHETAKKNNEGGTMTDAEALLSKTDDNCDPVVGEEPKAL
ncbi:hypothetical protein IGI04_015427 [Brassica rapa subsp. trilocularis]|uniref:Protein kinase domain-containing protein n=1 Tax=Brassica rapa subsp. trilocularis TaxID=1813537 RepID=A0ABQ7MQJ3_BRACM|nr:hypothetical protein IGI04_015427 [Brassica rapa subsp. trilocularis]